MWPVNYRRLFPLWHLWFWRGSSCSWKVSEGLQGISVTSGTSTTVYRAERAISPADGSVSWVVIDDNTYDLHREASAYLDSLRARHLSWNTERIYAGRSALYLTSCAAHGVDWSRPTLGQLARFMRRLVQEPLPSRRRDAAWSAAVPFGGDRECGNDQSL